MASKMSKKRYVIDKFYMTLRHVEKSYKTNENEVSQKPKTRCEHLYKTCRNEDFLSQNRKMASGIIKKALRL